MKHLKVLLINPFIYDFAAYNFWSKPLGLLYIGSILRKNGVHISLIDCLETDEKKKTEDGRGHYLKGKVNKPEALKMIHKPMRRYGISEEELKKRIIRDEKPHLVLITSLMTYWYLGTVHVVNVIREVYPKTKIIVGGIYPSLCQEHARSSLNGVDLIVERNGLQKLYTYIEEEFSYPMWFKPGAYDLDDLPYPAFDLYEKIDFAPLLTSVGCIFKCTYCATSYLCPKIKKRNTENVINEVLYWISLGVKRFVLYDDCFLHDKEEHAVLILKRLKNLKESMEIFNPNALNAAFIDSKIAELLFASGFREVRIGLESTNPKFQKETGGKIDNSSFKNAVKFLKSAGFSQKNIHVYLLAGLPFQRWEEVKEAIDYVVDMGCTPHLAEYAPCPHTEMFEKYKKFSRFPLEEEPLFQNNSLFPFAWSGFSEEDLQFLKSYLKEKIQ
ncbi:MAG: radical SAM protein [Deltaproteobacteria bacterium]|nr:radical SAM protein [Deltaproteobacteria bacterium]